jgi:hypothetical protein
MILGWLGLTLMLNSCATTSMSPDTKARHILRVETCLAEVAHLDPGPIDGVSDAQLEAGLQRYYDQFVATDVMAMGRDPKSAEVQQAAFKVLLYHCWRDGKLPPGDPLADVDPASRGYQ